MMLILDQTLPVADKGTVFCKRLLRTPIEACHGFLHFVAAGRILGRALCIVLTISLLVSSTPAATPTMVGVVKEWQVGFGFWLRANGLPGKFYRTLAGEQDAKPQEKQRDRDARVSQIKIYPGDLTLQVDERVTFAAVAYDSDRSTVGGVKFQWSAQDEGRSRRVRVSQAGDFEALVPGTFKVTAEGAGRRAHVKITVLKVANRRHKNAAPVSVSPISTRDLPAVSRSTTQGRAGRYPVIAKTSESTAGENTVAARRFSGSRKLPVTARRLRAHAAKKSHNPNAAPTSPMPFLPGDGWDGTNFWSADDPGNGVGNPPGGGFDGGAGSGNFKFAAPQVSLPGRGLDISLGLAYNSRLWNKADNQITFDIDRGWPAPGFSLGFGKLFGMGGGSMLIDADGTRHAFTGTLTTYPGGTQYFVGHTTDGSLIDYWHWTNPVGWILYGQAKLPNGTVIDYAANGPGGIFPTKITDPNGNFITITYVQNAGPQIETVTDTLNRVINFHYDSNNLLTAITVPPLGTGSERTVARLHYKQQSLNYSFSGLTAVVRDSNPWVLDAIYYPGTNTGYWFGDADSYSTYGMIAKVVEQRGMSFSAAPLDEQGTVTQGQMTQQTHYNYPLYVGDSSGTPGSNLNDAPNYTSLTESWTRDATPGTIDSATTNFLVVDNASNPAQPAIPSRKVEVTLPNNTKSIQYSYSYTNLADTDPRKALDGLVYQDETRDSSNTLLQTSVSTWEKGAYDSPRPTRVEATNERNETTATALTYGSVYNQVIAVRNYDYDGLTVLRSATTEYQNSSNYTNRHIFNLPLVTEGFSGDIASRVSRTVYQYDGETLAPRPDVVHHAQAYNPHAAAEGFCFWDDDLDDPDCTGDCSPETPCNGVCSQIYYCPYISATDYRGNVTQVTNYADALNLTDSVTVALRYDITGNMVTTSTSCCEQTSINYTLDTQYAYPTSQTRGSATDSYATVKTSATYNFNTGLPLSGTDANDRSLQTTYNGDTLRPQTVTLPTGAHVDYAYDDPAMTVTESVYLSGHPADTGLTDKNTKYLNGRGQVRQERALGTGGIWDIVDIVYDSMGRVAQQSLPYRGGETPVWSTITYDALSRQKTVTGPDGSATENFYNEANRPNVASSAPGETTRVVDAWGRERWGRTNAQGRLVEVVEPNPSGDGLVATGGLLTSYSYNTLGKLVDVYQGSQTRSFKYDSLGRLTAQKLAETSATLNDSGIYVGINGSGAQWSDFFKYDIRSNLVQSIDARGVKTNFWYFNSQGHTDPADGTIPEPLNRLQSISYDTSGDPNHNLPPGDPNYYLRVLDAATVTYQYRTKDTPSHVRDVTQPVSVTTNGVSVETYDYDAESRVNIKSITLNGRPAMVTDYAYDSLDRVTDVTYPKRELGVTGSPRKVVHHDYDVASRLTSLTVDGATHASQLVYNASSQVTSLNVGASGPNQTIESYNFDQQTGLLASQTLARSSAPTNWLLNLSYDYAGANGKRTGQLTRILNNLNHNKDRGYTYDPLGRLITAQGGPSTSPLWTQNYSYDRYGNRTTVSASGYSASLNQEGSSPTGRDSVDGTATAARGSAGILPAVTANRELADTEPRSVSSKSASARGQRGPGSTPTISEGDRRSHHPSRSRRINTAAPQGGSPVFTDDPLIPGVTVIQAVHITELRNAVNQARARAGLATASWGETIATGGLINAAHIIEVRARLAEARVVLGLPAASYTDPSLSAGMTVKAAHIQELRQSVTEALIVNASIPLDGLANLSFDAATNRITTTGFAYDAAGNQTRAQNGAGGWQRFQYDAANRLVKVIADGNGAVLATYTYGDSNERLITEESNLRTYYVSESGSVIAEYFETGASTTPQWSKSYIYLEARLLSTLTPNGPGGETVQYHHPDRLGTRLVTNAQDTTWFEQQTLPFGTALNETPTSGGSIDSSNRRFTSYDRSPTTGLDHAINRHYDPQQGRFTQVDPIGMAASDLADPQSLNLYAYCGNDPVNNLDPSGLFWGKLKRFFVKAMRILNAVFLTIVAILEPTHLSIGAAIHAWFDVFGGWKRVLGNKAPGWLTFALSANVQITGGGGFQVRGSPPWNPDAGTGVSSAFGFQGQGPTYNCRPPDCQNEIPALVFEVNVPRPSSVWSELGTGLSKLHKHSTAFSMGALDIMTEFPGTGISWHRELRRALWTREQNANLTSSVTYKVGEVYGVGNVVVTGGGGAVNAAGRIIPATGSNIGRGVSLFGGKILYMKHAAHKFGHTLPHYQIHVGRHKIRHIIGTRFWKWTKGRF